MKITIIAAIFCMLGLYSSAQNSYSLKGSVADSAAKSKLSNATITIVTAKDSILKAFAWAGQDGSFAINGLPKGKFLLMVTYPGYADYVDNFSLDSAHTSHDFGRVDMILKSSLLAEVIVKAKVTAIKIKGDTTEFNAKAYVIQPNDKVEDLLKQLPGIQVDKDGKITAQGQTVTKVLVDGEEFFGDDPTLVTKNIRADMVDKVQLYDKTSDQAAFTGIDDGKKTKTINIKLLANKKNGYFGKVDLEQGTNGYYQDEALFNKFEAKEKMSVYGTLGDDGKIGLGWEDNSKAGVQSDNVQYGDDGGIYINNTQSDDLDSFDGQYNGQGIPLARTAGFHYDNKWDDDKQSINANYKVGSLEVTGTNTNINQNNLPDSIIKTNSNQTYDKFMFRQKLDATYETKLDTSSNLKVIASGTGKHSTVNEYNTAQSYLNDTLLNTNNRRITNTVNEQLASASAFYTKKFKKPGRTLSVLVKESIDNSSAKGYLDAHLRFYNKGILDTTQNQDINEYKTLDTKSAILNSNVTYTEPLSKRLSLIVNYGVGINNSTSDRRSYDSTGVGRYGHLDTALSNNYKFNQLSNQVGAIFNYKKGKGTLIFGTRATDVSYHQVDELSDQPQLNRQFLNWSPQASYQYKFSQQESLRIAYTGNTTQPTIAQIQPVVVNTDPLNITVGNPDLKPSFTNTFEGNYGSYKVLTGQNIYLYGSISFVSDPIVSNTNTDATGKSIYESVNLANHTPFNTYFGSYLSRKLEKADLNVGLNMYANGSTSYNYANNVLNTTDSYNYNIMAQVSKYKAKKYEMNFSFGPTFTVGKSSLQPLVNNNGTGLEGYGYFRFFLPDKFEIESDQHYVFTGRTESFNQDLSKFVLNASIGKSFFKHDDLKITVTGNDLLNQNVGFSRTATGNMITQNSYTSIKRFFMLVVVWNFNKMGGAPSK